MELNIAPTQPRGLIKKGLIKIIRIICSKKPNQIDLILDIHFGEHQEEIHYGSGNVTFGIKRGELKVKLTNGEVPLKNIKLKGEFQKVVETEVREEQGSERQIGAQAEPKNPRINTDFKKQQKISVKLKNKEYQVKTGGGKLDEPSWVFEVKTSKKILEGDLDKTKVATVDVKSIPCSLIATNGANLNRADLSFTNFNEADLSFADLRNANVQNARFNKNSLGISESLKQDLIKRGAIFEDSPGDRSKVLTPH